MINTALLLIDWQVGFDQHDFWGGNRNNPKAEEKGLTLLEKWRSETRPIFHCIHNSLEPESLLRIEKPSGQVKPEFKARDGESFIVKRVNSCFIGTDLEQQLRQQNISNLVICGLTTNHCVSTTTRMAGNLGFNVTLVGDACATFDRKGRDGIVHSAEEVHAISLANIHEEFCQVKDAIEVLSLK